MQDEDNNPLTRSQMNAPNRETIVIPFEFQKFVLADSGFDDKLRIICFGNSSNLKQLAENKDWFGDGTFDVSPLVFKQMFTLNILKNGKTLPMVFALLPNKTQQTYTRMFKMLIGVGLQDSFGEQLTFSTDFEMAILNSVIFCFPGVKLYGCYFHYTQAL